MVWERVELPDGDSVGTLCGVHLIGSTWSVRPHPSHCPYNLVPLLQTAVASDLIEHLLRHAQVGVTPTDTASQGHDNPYRTAVSHSSMGEDRGSDPLPVKQRLPCARSLICRPTRPATHGGAFSAYETRCSPPMRETSLPCYDLQVVTPAGL